LQGGTTTTQGRVEICNSNVWGTVCDDSWGAVDARVACRQLGLPSSSKCSSYWVIRNWVIIDFSETNYITVIVTKSIS